MTDPVFKDRAELEAWVNWRCICGQTPCVGLDCGVWLPGQKPRKKPAPKSRAEMAEIRAKAWATRRRVTLAHAHLFEEGK